MLIQRMRLLGLGHLLGVPTVSVPISPLRAPQFKRPSTPVSTDGEEDYPKEAPWERRDSPNRNPQLVVTPRKACWMRARGPIHPPTVYSDDAVVGHVRW